MNSTSTKLDVINTALRNIGERVVTTTNDSQASELALSLLPEVLTFIVNRHFWFFCNKFLNTDPLSLDVDVSYSGDTVGLLKPIIRVNNIYSNPTPGNRIRHANFCRLDSFEYAYSNVAMTSDTDEVVYYTIDRFGDIRLFPYPVTDAAKANLRIEVYSFIPTPTLDSDVFEIPEPYVPMVSTLLSARLSNRLLNSPQMAQVYEAEYEVLHRKLVETTDTKPKNYRWSVL